jgi:hypothetical protein
MAMKARGIILIALLLACLAAWLGLLWLEQSWAEQPYSFIEDRLYVGERVATPPPRTSAVVNLCETEDPYQVEVSLWEPLDGTRVPSIEWLRRVVDFIDTNRRAGRTTYVHCRAGVNRSGLVVTAYVMFEHGWGRDQSLAFVQSKRPQVLPNPSYMRLLSEWEQVIAEVHGPQ